MTHTRAMGDSEGTFSKPEAEKYMCRWCKKEAATCRIWESKCSGYEDYKYNCEACGYSWWVDGGDS